MRLSEKYKAKFLINPIKIRDFGLKTRKQMNTESETNQSPIPTSGSTNLIKELI